MSFNTENLIIYDFSNLAFATMYSAMASSGGGEEDSEGMCVYLAMKKVLAQWQYLIGRQKGNLIFALDNFPKKKREIYPEYKKNRKEREFDRRPILKEMFSLINCSFAECLDEEADDTIASMVVQNEDKFTVIVSSDSDLTYLNRYPHNSCYNLIKNELYKEEYLHHKFDGLNSWHKIHLYKILFGEMGDNVRAVLPRARKKDIIPVLNECNGNLSDFYKKFKESKQSERTFRVFEENKEFAKISHQLIKLNTNLEITYTQNKFQEKKLQDFFDRFNIKEIKAKDCNIF